VRLMLIFGSLLTILGSWFFIFVIQYPSDIGLLVGTVMFLTGFTIAFVGYSRRSYSPFMPHAPRLTTSSGALRFYGSQFNPQSRSKSITCPICGLQFVSELAGSYEWAKMHYKQHLTQVHPGWVKSSKRWNEILAGFIVWIVLGSILTLFDPVRYVAVFVTFLILLVLTVALRSLNVESRRQAWHVQMVQTPSIP
jgi:hypothetical protein